MADSLNVSALVAYTDQISSGLAKAQVLGATTIKNDLVSVKYGVIGDKTQLNVMKHTLYGTNQECGTFTSTGQTTFLAPTITMFPVKFEIEVCQDKLKKYWYDYYQEREYNTDNLGSFEEVFTTNLLEEAQKEIDNMIWRAANTSPNYVTGLVASNSNLGLMDGFLETAYNSSASTVNITKTAMTVSNASVVVDSILATIAQTPILLEECNLYMSPTDFQIYLMSLRNQNLFHFDVQSKDITEINHPGALNLVVKKTNGMNGAASGTGLATRHDNIWLLVTAASDLEFKTFYDQNSDSIKSRLKVKLGTGYYQPELVVKIA